MKKILIFTFLYCICALTCPGKEVDESGLKFYARVDRPVPVMNTPEFLHIFGGPDGKTLRQDTSGLVRELEFIALPGTVFSVENVIQDGQNTIYEVKTRDYPYLTSKGYFVDSRFVTILISEPDERVRNLPSKKDILDNLLSAEGSDYIWGGNYKEGIPDMLSLYPPSSDLDKEIEDKWTMKGVDCSGLLYEATNGYTPRNTDSLIKFGNPVSIKGLNIKEIINIAEPLDIIVWRGHVIIIIDNDRVIESRLDYDKEHKGNQGGVKVRFLKEVLGEVLQERIPENSYRDGFEGKKVFVIRRWYPI